MCTVFHVMPTFSLAAITIPDAQELTELLTMMGTGFVVVMSVLCFLWVSISVSGKFFVSYQERILKQKEVLGGPNTHTSPAEEPNDGISATTLAILAAAVQTTVNGPFRIVDIEHRHSSHEAEHQASNWSVEGRRSIFSSHQVR